MLTFDRQVRYGESHSDADGEWIVDHGLHADESRVIVTVGVAFMPPSIFPDGTNHGGIDPSPKLKKIWEKGVEKVWNGQALFDDGEALYPIVFDLRYVPLEAGHVDQFAPDGWNHVVTVHKGTGKFDMLNWYTKPKGWGSGFHGEAAAHEVGQPTGNVGAGHHHVLQSGWRPHLPRRQGLRRSSKGQTGREVFLVRR